MCEKCDDAEGTFREVIEFSWGTLLADRYGSFHRDLHPGDIVYVVRRGWCGQVDSDRGHGTAAAGLAVEVLTTSGLVEASAEWLLRCTVPTESVLNPGEQNV